MIDMAHDGNDRRSGLEIFLEIIIALEPDFDVCFANAPDVVSEFGHDEFRRVRINSLLQRCHNAELHQGPSDVDAAFSHAVGQFLNGDRFGYHHVADNFYGFGWCLMTAPFALTGTPDRRQAPCSFFLIKRLGDRQFTAAATGLAAPRARSPIVRAT